MSQLLPFFIILLAGLAFSEIFRRLHLPLVISLIVAGVIIGPEVLDLVQTSPAIELVGRLGLVFLMFIAGLEAKFDNFKRLRGRILSMTLINSTIPFLAGYAITWYLGYDLIASLLVAIAFMSSSVAIIIPILEAKNVLKYDFGKVMIGAIVLQDILSLVLLSIVLQSLTPINTLSIPVFYLILVATLIGLRILIPLVRGFFKDDSLPASERQLFQEELRLILVILIGTVVIFELLGLHDIVAGFFAGFVLSDSIKSRITKEKIYAIGYGFFIPVFFILIGSKTNISVFGEASGALLVTFLVVTGALLSKIVGGAISALANGFSKKQGGIIAFSVIPQLFTTLAVAFVGLELGLIDDNMLNALVVLSVVSTFIGPIVTSRLLAVKKV